MSNEDLEVIDLAEYRRLQGEKRQKAQIQQSIRRLSQLPLGEIANSALTAAVSYCESQGFDTLEKGFIQNMEVMQYLMRGVLEATYTLETDNTLMVEANRINLNLLLEIEENGSG